MKTRYFLLCAMFLTAMYGCTRKQPLQGPSISFSDVSYDFGRVQQGTMVTHQYPFTNAGTDNLIIKDVFTSCGCTAAIAFSRDVSPAGHGAITANFDSSNYLGPVTKTITVSTNDPLKPMVALTLTGRVVSDLVVTPPILFLGSIRKGSTKERGLTIVASDPAVKITSLTASKPYIRLTPTAQSALQKTFMVTISRDAPVGPINSDIQVGYIGTSARRESRSVPVIGNIVGDILTNPNSVEMGVIKKGVRHPAMDVFLYTQPVKAFGITKIQTSPDVLKVKVFKQGKGSYRLELRPGRIKTSGRLRGKITVHTTMSTMPVVVIPFNGVVI
ncbi:MAG: DUF1573 domain-containing protein [Deltaproteobacteria bacterium]|nr:DUF1573 domain-containing protein [Deltaproteobacteria bacterium]